MRRRAWLMAGMAFAMTAGWGSGVAHAADLSSPVGNWRTIDDKTNKPSGTMVIYQRDGLLFGRVTSIADPKMQTVLCHDCEGWAQNKPVMGLEVLRDMHPNGAQWDGGTILNPQDGHVYHCRMHLGPKGQTLVLRGYIGLPMLGRTQTWQRLPG